MAVERIAYTIRKDGTVEEKVEGVPGPMCEQLTQVFEARLGEVVERVHTAEYVLLPKPKPTPATRSERAREERIEG